MGGGVIPEGTSLSVMPQILDSYLSDESGTTLTITNACFMDGMLTDIPYALCIDSFSLGGTIKLCIKDVADDTDGRVYFQTDVKKINTNVDTIFISTGDEILNQSTTSDSDFWESYGTECTLHICFGDENGYHNTDDFYDGTMLNNFKNHTNAYGDNQYELSTSFGNKKFHKIMIMVIWTTT